MLENTTKKEKLNVGIYFFIVNKKREKRKEKMKTERINEIVFLVGTSKEENNKVIDLGNPGDIWFHARNTSSCHVLAILSNSAFSLLDKKEKRKQLRMILKKGAELVKRNTAKLRSEKNVEITYTDIKHVEKTEYIGCVRHDREFSKAIHI